MNPLYLTTAIPFVNAPHTSATHSSSSRPM